MKNYNTVNDYKHNSLFFGVAGVENTKKALDVLAEAFPEHHIHIMDSEVFNNTIDAFIKKQIDWIEDQRIREFTTNPENIQGALANALKIKDAVGTDYFILSDLVNRTNMSYKQAKSILDLQYAFGFMIKDTTVEPNRYKVASSKEDQKEYLNSIISGLDNEKAQLLRLIEQIDNYVEPVSSDVQSDQEHPQ